MYTLDVAAKMAGQWWAERLSDAFMSKRDEFAAAVEIRVLQELRGDFYWDWFGEQREGAGHINRCVTENDYDPHHCLIPALLEVFPGVPPFKLRTALPTKHRLDIFPDKLKPKEGYGNWTADIVVPERE